MPSTYTLISSNTLSASAASVTFSAIPSTYTDLVIRFSVRTDSGSGAALNIEETNTNADISQTYMYGNGATATSSRDTGSYVTLYDINSPSTTSNTFTNGELYIPSYTSSGYKPQSAFHVRENNATTSYIHATAILKNATVAISSLKMYNAYGGNLVSGSSFYLYGIKNS